MRYGIVLKYCKNSACHNVNINYTFNVTLQVNIMTLRFQTSRTASLIWAITATLILKKTKRNIRLERVDIDCSRDESAVFELTPGKIDYYFLAASGFAGTSKILKN